MKGFRPVFDIPAKGFVNSLQLIAIPHGVLDSSQWGKKREKKGGDGDAMDIDGEGKQVNGIDGSEDEEADDFFAEPVVKVKPVTVIATKPTGNKAKQAPDFLLVAAVAREPRLGRWMSVNKGVRDGTLLVHLKLA